MRADSHRPSRRRYTVRPSKVFKDQWIVFDRESCLVVASGFDTRQKACSSAIEFNSRASS